MVEVRRYSSFKVGWHSAVSITLCLIRIFVDLLVFKLKPGSA